MNFRSVILSSSVSRLDHLFQLALLLLRAGFKGELFLLLQQIGWWIQKPPLTLIKRVPHSYLSQHQKPQLSLYPPNDLPFGRAPSRLYLCLPPGLLISCHTPLHLRLLRSVLLRLDLAIPKFFTVSYTLQGNLRKHCLSLTNQKRAL